MRDITLQHSLCSRASYRTTDKKDGYGRGNWGNLADEQEAELANAPHERRSKTVNVVSAEQFERLTQAD